MAEHRSDYYKHKKRGPAPKFKNADELWEAVLEYFEWNDANPIIEQRPFSYMGGITYAEIEKPRPLTIVRMCSFIGISRPLYTKYKNKRGFEETCSAIEDIIYAQKFEGAAAGQMNPVIIARDLSLRENVDHTTNGENLPASVQIDKAKVVAKDVQDILDMV